MLFPYFLQPYNRILMVKEKISSKIRFSILYIHSKIQNDVILHAGNLSFQWKKYGMKNESKYFVLKNNRLIEHALQHDTCYRRYTKMRHDYEKMNRLILLLTFLLKISIADASSMFEYCWMYEYFYSTSFSTQNSDSGESKLHH